MKRILIQFVKPLVEYFPRIAMTYRCIRDNWQLFKFPKNTPMGFKFMGNNFMQKGLFEPEETEIINKLLMKIDVFINVGANIGYYCCIALSKGKYVVAFEPISLNLTYLLKNVEANGWDSRIEIHPIALSCKAGTIKVYGGGTNASLIKGWSGTPEKYVTLVSCSTMDDVLGTRFNNKRCLILVDIEGAERMMLEGASQIVGMIPKPIWMMEIAVLEHQPKNISINPNLLSTFQIFWNSGYEAITADRYYRVISHEEIEEIVRSGTNTLSSYNFLFIEKGKKDMIIDI